MKKFPKSRLLLFGVNGILLFSLIITNTCTAESINIICTNSVLADFTSNIITENVTIEYIMPSGVCPAFYDTCPSDVNKIVSADIIISLGSSIKEPWLTDLLVYNSDFDLIECKNLGEWNIPSGAKTYIECLKFKLSELFPALIKSIDTNTQSYIDQIDNKSQELKQAIEDAGYLKKKIICIIWQKDFIEWLGLNITYSYSPPQSLSVQDEIDIINTASDGDVYAVVDNLQSGTEFGARVASETGASHVILTNFPQAIPGTDTYLDMITYNTEQLLKGISTYEFKQGEISAAQSQISSLETQRNISLALIGILILLVAILFIMYKMKK
jgi:ABC-type Zn uptake system ZnuABC Zn-binding protein ZnuA